MTDKERGSRPEGTRPLPTDDPNAHPDEPGAYIGNRPEREAETIPGGVRSGDQRIAAYATEPGPVEDDSDAPPDAREAGQSR
jgi:hypothetical protein